MSDKRLHGKLTEYNKCPTLTSFGTGDQKPLVVIGGGMSNMKPMRWGRTEKGKQERRKAQKQGMDKTPFSDGCRELKPIEGNVGCITSALNKDALLGNGARIRRLTPIECARLQGFPDNWHEGVSDSAAYKAYGNAVTVAIVKLIAERLLEKD